MKEKLKKLLMSLDVSDEVMNKVMEMNGLFEMSDDKLKDMESSKTLLQEEFDKFKVDSKKEMGELQESFDNFKIDSKKEMDELTESCTNQIDAEFNRLESETDALLESMKPEIEVAKVMTLLESLFKDMNTSEDSLKLIEENSRLKRENCFSKTFSDFSDSDKERATGLLEGIKDPESFEKKAKDLAKSLTESNVPPVPESPIDVLKYL